MDARLRTFTNDEVQALSDRLYRAWNAARAQGPVKVPVLSLLPSFGLWSRVAPQTDEPQHHVAMVLYRNRETDEFALLMVPIGFADEDVAATEEAVWATVKSAWDAVVGDFLVVWQWALERRPTMASAAMMFVGRLPKASEETRFLAAFTLTERTYAAAADRIRAAIFPVHSLVSQQVDKAFWEAPETARATVTDWAIEEAQRFVARCPARSIAEDDGALGREVDRLVEAFIDEQFAYDPSGAQRVPFAWRPTSS